MIQDFDIAILGSGFAAWSCACALQENGMAVAVMQRENTGPAVGEYLPPEGVQALTRLGLNGLLDSDMHQTSAGTVSLWGGALPVRRDTMMQPGGRAVSLDRLVLDQTLQKRATASGVTTLTLGQVPKVTGRAGEWLLRVNTGDLRTDVGAKYLIDATGRAAALSRAMGAQVERADELVGVATILEQTSVEDTVLRIEAVEDGWCYAVPLSNERLAAVFLTDAKELPRDKSACAEKALKVLNAGQLIGPLIRGTTDKPSFTIVPAWSQITQPSIGAGWAAIGDAAMGFDPLASAGLTKALLDISALLETEIVNRDGVDIAKQRHQRYEDYQRQLQQNYTAASGAQSAFWTRRQKTS